MRKLTTFIFLLLFVLLANSQQHAANISSSKTERLDVLMKHCNENKIFNGTILVAENGNVIYKNAFGQGNKETKQYLNNESVFYLASVSKQFTGMAIMVLKEQNKLSYDDKLSKYFPQFPPYADKVTIKHLLNHTSGIPDYFRLNAYKPGLKNEDVLAVLVKRDSLDFAPGQRFSYSNGGYVLLSMIAEKASGMSYPKFMSDYVFKPLNMKSTLVYDQSTPAIKNRAVGYDISGKKNDYDILTTGDGGMFSNTNDLYLWAQSLSTEKLVSKNTMKDAFTPAVLNNGEKSNYGFGWGLSEKNKKKYIIHSGGLSGFRTFISHGLDDKQTYILLTNNGDASAMEEIGLAIDNILSGTPHQLPDVPISFKLTELLTTGSPEAAVETARKLLKEKSGFYLADESGINRLGYKYLGEKKNNIAILLFKFNVECNPSSYNVYDSMGEAWLAQGDTSNAITNYKKSVQLNPNNTNGIKVLKDLGVTTSDILREIKVPIEKLKLYTGKYELVPGFVLDITLDGEQLYVQPTGQAKIKLFPATEIDFYMKEVDAQVTFHVGPEGKIASLTLHQRGNTVAKKISD